MRNIVSNCRLLIKQRSCRSGVNNHFNDSMSREHSPIPVCHSCEHCANFGAHLSSQSIAYCEYRLLAYLPLAPSRHHPNWQCPIALYIFTPSGLQGNLSQWCPSSPSLGLPGGCILIPIVCLSGPFDIPSHMSSFE